MEVIQIFAVFIGEKMERENLLIDQGPGILDFDISNSLPGYKVIGIHFYPNLKKIMVHVIREEK